MVVLQQYFKKGSTAGVKHYWLWKCIHVCSFFQTCWVLKLAEVKIRTSIRIRQLIHIVIFNSLWKSHFNAVKPVWFFLLMLTFSVIVLSASINQLLNMAGSCKLYCIPAIFNEIPTWLNALQKPPSSRYRRYKILSNHVAVVVFHILCTDIYPVFVICSCHFNC